MPIKQTVPTNSSDSVQFGNATTPVAAQVTGAEVSTGNGYLAMSTTAGGTVTERMRIDNAGRVGIGTSSPAFPLDVAGAGGAAIRGGNGFNWYNSDNTNNYYIYNSGATGASNANLLFVQGGVAERMRIDSSGNVLVGATSLPTNAAGIFSQNGVASRGYRAYNYTSFGTNQYSFYWTGSALQAWVDGSNIGNVSISSDYRIKKNIETNVTPALNRIEQLRPVTYEFANYKEVFKADGIVREGFIAHELQEIIPSAVEGEKDAEDQIQSLKLDALCSVMVKAIQELSAKVTALEAQLKGTV